MVYGMRDRLSIDERNNLHFDSEYRKVMIRLKEEELDYLKRITIALEKLMCDGV